MKISQKLVAELDKTFGENIFDSRLSELTALELYQYMEASKFDVCHYVWTYHVSWGFESNWAWEYTISEEEKTKYINLGCTFEGVYNGFDINKKLKDIPLWAPQDHS